MIIAAATCSGTEYSTLVTIGSPANTAVCNEADGYNPGCDCRDTVSQFCSGTTTATCPSGTTVLSCSCLSHWAYCRSTSRGSAATLERTSTSCSYTASGRSRSYARCGSTTLAGKLSKTTEPTPTPTPTPVPTPRVPTTTSQTATQAAPTVVYRYRTGSPPPRGTPERSVTSRRCTRPAPGSRRTPPRQCGCAGSPPPRGTPERSATSR